MSRDGKTPGRLEANAVRFEGFRAVAPRMAGTGAAAPVGAGGDAESRQAVYVAGGATRVLRPCVVENALAVGALRSMPSSSVLIWACRCRNKQRDLGIGAAVDDEGNITILESTVFLDSAEGGGGAIANRAGGTAVIVNSTFESNWSTATNTCGGGAILNEGLLTIRSSTIAFNTARCGVGAAGAGILTDVRAGSPGMVDIVNTLLAADSCFFIRATGGLTDVEDCGGNWHRQPGSFAGERHDPLPVQRRRPWQPARPRSDDRRPRQLGWPDAGRAPAAGQSRDRRH